MNGLLLIIDSLDYTRCQSASLDLLPNLNARSKRGIKCENMYSQAPYTEAAAMAIYCGQNTLDNHGYIERYQNAGNALMEVMQKAGYETYFNSLQPQCYPSSLRRGIDSIYYNRGYDNEALWNYRFSYFSERGKEGKLTKTDYKQLERILDDNFADWIRFLKELILDDSSVENIKGLNKNFDAENVLTAVESEAGKYNQDKISYINEIIKEGHSHALFQIPYFSQIDYEIPEMTERLYENECADLCRRIRKLNFIQNAAFNLDIYRGLIRAVSSYMKNHDKEEFDERIYVIKNALFLCNNNKKYGKAGHALKGQPSFNTHIKAFLKWLDNRENREQPYFACIHVDDIHFPEMFYTYDTDDAALLQSELKLADAYLKERKLNTKGTVSLDLSLRYADAKCESLFSELEKRGMMDDLTVFVTADHGFSYSGYPIRRKLINTFYLENFKIPFYIFGEKVAGRQIHTLQSSIDIPPTICKVMGIDVPESFSGCCVLHTEDAKRIITIEYCGGGCPDIDNRKLMIAAFDNHYMAASLVKLDEPFRASNITEIYNLKKDPLQRKNLVKKIDYKVISRYIKTIEKRIKEIRRTNNIYLKAMNDRGDL